MRPPLALPPRGEARAGPSPLPLAAGPPSARTSKGEVPDAACRRGAGGQASRLRLLRCRRAGAALSRAALAYPGCRPWPVAGTVDGRACRPPACGRVTPGASGRHPPSGSPDSLQSMREPPGPCGCRPPARGWAVPGALGLHPPYGSAEPPQLIRGLPNHCRRRFQGSQIVSADSTFAGDVLAVDRLTAEDRGGARSAASSRTSTTRRARCIESPLPEAAAAAVSPAAGAPPRIQAARQLAEDADSLC